MLRTLSQIGLICGLLAACGTRLQTDSSEQALPDERPANASCLAFERPQANAAVKLQRVFSSVTLKEIIALVQVPGGNRYYAVQKNGLITTFSKADGSDKSTFLDLRSTVNASPQEAGLLGIAFHPTKAGEFYLSYTVPSSASRANLRSTIARFHTSDGLTAANKPEVLLTLEQPYNNHNGGHIAFGPDGYLYAAFGDGGSAGDPLTNGQNLNTLFGKILRIDVNSPGAYTIPKDNPFVGKANVKAEIFTYGMRNTWRFNFDRGTGDLWAGDVGQDRYEEIDILKKGGNYGWNIKEGTACYKPSSNCSTNNLIDPVYTYSHTEGSSVTGGFVYRGKAISSLVGLYIFGDFVSGQIWNLTFDQNGKAKAQSLISTGFNVSSFAEDNSGELYVLDYGNGAIYQIVPNASTTPVAKAPARLSETGCYQTAGLIPYEVNSPLWSDGAAKKRWFAIPDGSKLSVATDGHIDFPKGSVLVKEFALGGKPIETRLFILHKDGVWAGYTYEWNTAGTDADLVANGSTKTIGNQTWTYPSQGQCLQCHNAAAGYSLGLTLSQLNRPTADGVSQLDALEQLQFFNAALPRPLPTLPEPSKATRPAEAARAYLNANCAFCHRPGGTGGGALDLRYETAFSATGLCNVKPGSGDLGISNALLVAPGAPERSVLLARISQRGNQQMPPVGSNLVDNEAKQWVNDWIKGLTNCN